MASVKLQNWLYALSKREGVPVSVLREVFGDMGKLVKISRAVGALGMLLLFSILKIPKTPKKAVRLPKFIRNGETFSYDIRRIILRILRMYREDLATLYRKNAKYIERRKVIVRYLGVIPKKNNMSRLIAKTRDVIIERKRSMEEILFSEKALGKIAEKIDIRTTLSFGRAERKDGATLEQVAAWSFDPDFAYSFLGESEEEIDFSKSDLFTAYLSLAQILTLRRMGYSVRILPSWNIKPNANYAVESRVLKVPVMVSEIAKSMAENWFNKFVVIPESEFSVQLSEDAIAEKLLAPRSISKELKMTLLEIWAKSSQKTQDLERVAKWAFKCKINAPLEKLEKLGIVRTLIPTEKPSFNEGLMEYARYLGETYPELLSGYVINWKGIRSQHEAWISGKKFDYMEYFPRSILSSTESKKNAEIKRREYVRSSREKIRLDVVLGSYTQQLWYFVGTSRATASRVLRKIVDYSAKNDYSEYKLVMPKDWERRAVCSVYRAHSKEFKKMGVDLWYSSEFSCDSTPTSIAYLLLSKYGLFFGDQIPEMIKRALRYKILRRRVRYRPIRVPKWLGKGKYENIFLDGAGSGVAVGEVSSCELEMEFWAEWEIGFKSKFPQKPFETWDFAVRGSKTANLVRFAWNRELGMFAGVLVLPKVDLTDFEFCSVRNRKRYVVVTKRSSRERKESLRKRRDEELEPYRESLKNYKPKKR